MANDRIRVKIEKARLSFPNLKEPQAPEGSTSGPRYNANFLIVAKSKNHKKLHDAEKAIEADPKALKIWGGRVPKKNFATGINIGEESTFVNDEGEEVIRDGYEGMVYVNAKATPDYPPQLVDRHRRQVQRDDAEEVFYAGCYVNAVLEPYAYNKAGNQGVSWGLLAIQFDSDGERFGGTGIDVDDYFDDIPDGDAADDGDDWDD